MTKVDQRAFPAAPATYPEGDSVFKTKKSAVRASADTVQKAATQRFQTPADSSKVDSGSSSQVKADPIQAEVKKYQEVWDEIFDEVGLVDGDFEKSPLLQAQEQANAYDDENRGLDAATHSVRTQNEPLPSLERKEVDSVPQTAKEKSPKQADPQTTEKKDPQQADAQQKARTSKFIKQQLARQKRDGIYTFPFYEKGLAKEVSAKEDLDQESSSSNRGLQRLVREDHFVTIDTLNQKKEELLVEAKTQLNKKIPEELAFDLKALGSRYFKSAELNFKAVEVLHEMYKLATPGEKVKILEEIKLISSRATYQYKESRKLLLDAYHASKPQIRQSIDFTDRQSIRDGARKMAADSDVAAKVFQEARAINKNIGTLTRTIQSLEEDVKNPLIKDLLEEVDVQPSSGKEVKVEEEEGVEFDSLEEAETTPLSDTTTTITESVDKKLQSLVQALTVEKDLKKAKELMNSARRELKEADLQGIHVPRREVFLETLVDLETEIRFASVLEPSTEQAHRAPKTSTEQALEIIEEANDTYQKALEKIQADDLEKARDFIDLAQRRLLDSPEHLQKDLSADFAYYTDEERQVSKSLHDLQARLEVLKEAVNRPRRTSSSEVTQKPVPQDQTASALVREAAAVHSIAQPMFGPPPRPESQSLPPSVQQQSSSSSSLGLTPDLGAKAPKETLLATEKVSYEERISFELESAKKLLEEAERVLQSDSELANNLAGIARKKIADIPRQLGVISKNSKTSEFSENLATVQAKLGQVEKELKTLGSLGYKMSSLFSSFSNPFRGRQSTASIRTPDGTPNSTPGLTLSATPQTAAADTSAPGSFAVPLADAVVADDQQAPLDGDGSTKKPLQAPAPDLTPQAIAVPQQQEEDPVVTVSHLDLLQEVREDYFDPSLGTLKDINPLLEEAKQALASKDLNLADRKLRLAGGVLAKIKGDYRTTEAFEELQAQKATLQAQLQQGQTESQLQSAEEFFEAANQALREQNNPKLAMQSLQKANVRLADIHQDFQKGEAFTGLTKKVEQLKGQIEQKNKEIKTQLQKDRKQLDHLEQQLIPVQEEKEAKDESLREKEAKKVDEVEARLGVKKQYPAIQTAIKFRGKVDKDLKEAEKLTEELSVEEQVTTFISSEVRSRLPSDLPKTKAGLIQALKGLKGKEVNGLSGWQTYRQHNGMVQALEKEIKEETRESLALKGAITEKEAAIAETQGSIQKAKQQLLSE